MICYIKCINTIHSMMKYHREHFVAKKLYEDTFKSQPVKNGDKVPHQKRPFKLDCQILRNIHRNGISTKQYFHARQFSYFDGGILAKGEIFEELDSTFCDAMKNFVFPLKEINDGKEIKIEELFYENNYLFFVAGKPLLNKSTVH